MVLISCRQAGSEIHGEGTFADEPIKGLDRRVSVVYDDVVMETMSPRHEGAGLPYSFPPHHDICERTHVGK